MDINSIRHFLLEQISKATSQDGLNWLEAKLNLLKGDEYQKTLYLPFSQVPRFVGKNQMSFTDSDLVKANQIRTNFNPSSWTVDQAARVLLITSIPSDKAEKYKSTLDNLFISGDVNELIALYSALPLYPFPEVFKDRAAEGIRTNMSVVFDAVALNNPYPSEYLSEAAWNQLVLKAVFLNRPLYLIQGIDKRRNFELAKMLSDFAHERWAAKRTVTPELWRNIAPFINETFMEDILRVYNQENITLQEAAMLACSESSYAPAKMLREKNNSIKERIFKQDINWKYIGEKWMKESM